MKHEHNIAASGKVTEKNKMFTNITKHKPQHLYTYYELDPSWSGNISANATVGYTVPSSKSLGFQARSSESPQWQRIVEGLKSFPLRRSSAQSWFDKGHLTTDSWEGDLSGATVSVLCRNLNIGFHIYP